MENYSVVIFILAIMIGLSAVADKIRVPYPVLLVVAGMLIGFVPALSPIELNPEVIFLIFLPPMLYDAAFNISFKEFRININTISTLSISLVFVTVIVIAIIAHYCIPGMSWPLSFVLGAILSATDAVAAISATKGSGLSHNTVTIIEGESLINDASALVAYRFAVAAVTGATFVFWKASLNFAFLLLGGIVIGNVLGQLLALVIRQIRNNTMAVIGLILLMPFVTYLVAEDLRVSGVIAVVTLGLIISRYSQQVFPDDLKQQSKSVWDIIVFLLNGLVFILIGLEFPHVVKGIDREEIGPYIFYAFLIWVGTLVLRTGRMFMQQINLQKSFKKGKGRITEHALLDFKNSFIISWSGMRGIASLALALGLPVTLHGGELFPQRNAIIFISVVVVLFTLIIQGLTLPWVIRKLSPEQKTTA